MPPYCPPGFWWIFPLVFGLFWVSVIALVVWRGRGWWGGHTHGADAAAVLRERFARGEIELEEFQRRLSVLERR